LFVLSKNNIKIWKIIYLIEGRISCEKFNIVILL